MSEIKNVKKAALRIKQAVKNKENIILFSDADFDGVSSLLVLEEAILTLGGKISLAYFPNREKEGYGLSEGFLNKIKKLSPGLLVISDSGVTSFEAIEMAKKMGFTVIVIDHHEVLNNTLPEADIIVDPKQASDPYPFKLMAACGLCFKVAEQMLVDNFSKSLKNNFLELVALGTIADLMPQTDDNEYIIKHGVPSISRSLRPAIVALADFFDKDKDELSSKEFASKIVSVLQLTDFVGNLTESYLFLKTSTQQEAQKMAKYLIDKSLARHQLVKELVYEVREKLEQKTSPIIFEGGKHIPHLLTGNIASKLCNKFKKPTFVYASKEKISRGSLRMPKGINGVEALSACADLLDVFGGHPQAAGFTVKNENLEKFEKCLESYFN